MPWKIKDEKVEKAIKALFIDDKSYQEAIDCGCEYAKYKGDNWIEVLGGNKLNIKNTVGNIRVEISLDKADVEFVHEYDPNDWNEYPNVKPPYDVMMRIEMYIGLGFAGFFKHFVEGDQWCYANGSPMPKEYSNNVKRYRPWED